MPISAPGQTIGIPPRFVNREQISIFEDFVAGASGNAFEWSGVSSSIWSFRSLGEFPERVGVLRANWSASGGGAFSMLMQPRVPIDVFSTFDWRCNFRFDGFDTSGGKGQAFGIGIGEDTDGCEGPNFLGFRAKGGAGLGGCSSALAANSLVACAEGAAFVGGVYFGSVALAGLTGRFIPLRMVYTRSGPRIDFYIDGTLVGTCTTASRFPTTRLYFVNPGMTQALGAAACFSYLDYFQFTGVLVR